MQDWIVRKIEFGIKGAFRWISRRAAVAPDCAATRELDKERRCNLLSDKSCTLAAKRVTALTQY